MLCFSTDKIVHECVHVLRAKIKCEVNSCFALTQIRSFMSVFMYYALKSNAKLILALL